MEEPKAIPTEIPIPVGAPSPGEAPKAPEKSDTEKMFDAINAASKNAQKAPGLAEFIEDRRRKARESADREAVKNLALSAVAAALIYLAYYHGHISPALAVIGFSCVLFNLGRTWGFWNACRRVLGGVGRGRT